MVHCNKKTRRSSGFTMVELMVVLAIMAILAALVGGGLIAYTRLARFEKNEANARTLFQTAQIALTRRDTAGELDDFRQKVLLNGQAGAHFDPDEQKADELNKNIYALYYDKVTDTDSDNELLRELLGDYIYDDSLLNAAICVEIDAASGQVYSVFCDTNADKLRFVERDGATNIYDRSYDHRRHDSLVGYYSAEDRVNVVELQQTKLKVKNPRLSNTETLTLSWGGDVTRDTQVQYVATGYSEDGTKKLFEIEVELPAVKTNEPVPLKTTIYSYDAAGTETPVERTLYYPLSYNKGNFVLTLDAMASADLLRSCENDSGASGKSSISVTDSSLYSITRLLSGGPQDFYVTLQAKARDGYSGSHTPSTPADTNVENSLFAKEATATKGNLTYFRHLYNLRWADNWASGQTAAYTLAAQSLGATGLNWTGGSVTVYCPAQGKDFPPEAKVPSAEEAVAWPTILTLPKNVTLDGKNITIMNLQLRGGSVSRTGRQGREELRDRYIGLVGENNGTIKNMTLRDADVQVNVEIVARAAGTLPLTGTTALQPLETTDSAYRDIRAVGALCGVNTGTLENCTLTHGKNNAVSAQVLAMLPFDDTATAMARTPKTNENGTAYYENEPRGIGGLVGVAIPKNGQTQTISALTVDANVTVAGLLQDKSPKAADETLTEQERYAAAASGQNSIWRSIGVGGVVGTMDAANLKLTVDASGKAITNKAAVTGSAFTGGVVGNLYNSGTPVTLTGLQNEGTVSVGANYLGSAEGENSRVLGQFFGGIAGYCKDVTLRGSTSTTRRDMTETQLKTAVKGGYAADGALTDDSPLKGDFVGGLVGFASGCTLDNCTTQKGYVLGRCFVGGMAGGFSGSELETTGGSNSSTVLGNRYVGGVVSVNGRQSTVSGVTNSGLVAGLGKNAAYVGGIAGLNDADWGSTGAANTTATIQNCVSSMASDTATNSSRSALLQALSTYKKASNQETTTRADYVGGLVGRNGKNAVLTWDTDANTVQIGAVICGNDFVGGLVGCNDATAKITNTSTSLLTVSGEVAGGNAVGGMIGLNLAPALPAANIKVTEISGTLCVGGVIGANMPVVGTDGTVFAIKETATSGGKVSTFTTTAKAGRIKADGLAGGIIGYNCLLASAPGAANLTTILPTVAQDTGLVTVSNTVARSDKEMSLNDAANQFNLEVNAYVGGIVGYNDAATSLTIRNATNGSDSNAASVGSLKMRGETGTLGSGVSLQEYKDRFNYNDYAGSKDARGSMAGGIIGCVTPKTKLEGCTNYGIVSHKSAAGGIAGWNDGSIKNCSTYATLGTQQDGYAYLGGIVGINNGAVTDSAPAASITVRGRYIIGGVAGLNLTDANITYNASNNIIPVTVQANECAGGVAGVNCGSIALGGTTLQVSITAESYAGGIAGSNNKRNDKAASIAGGNVTGTVTATKNYAGGAAGANYANISDVALTGGACVRANDQFAGGIAGSNRAGTNGQIGKITGCTNNAKPNGNNYTVYATNGNAGGIAGSNESGAQIVDSNVSGVKIGVAKCDAAAIAANNFGIITGGTVGSCDITFAGESIGAVTAINNAGATINNVTLDRNANIAFHGPATNVGGIAGKNAGTIDKCTVSSPALNLSSLTARADSISLGGAAGVNMQGATISETNVTLNITDNLNKYKNLGGVAGENAGGGTLLKCTYQGALGQADAAANKIITTGPANVLDTVGGIAGLNDGKVEECSVPKITLQVMGASGLSDSQTYAEKLKSASSVGGIAGRNNSTITSCYVATGEGGGSIITARYGFVGGVAGANNGSISSSGAKEVTELVKQVDKWFTDGSTNDMISTLKGDTYDSLKGVDTVSTNNYNNVYTATDLAKNDLLVGLRGTTDKTGKSSGYLGGVAGFNTVNGTITGAATGKWFVYGDNTTDESKIGGMIGMNEATGEVKLLVNCAAVRRFTRTDGKNDDDTTYRDNKNIAYVGGVIGVQQNTTNDKWVISECVNLGTVFDSGSNYIGGIIASWLKNGGTIEKSFNFGSLSTNTNSGNGSGTVGGIVGFFDQPTPGGTANILSCQNHGDILSSGNWTNDTKHGANDVAGILGKVVMADGANDYLRINIVDCVNGDVKMQCESLASGIMGWLGPYDINPDRVEVYIDRCRNYATDVKIYHKSNDTNLFAGICGNRGNGGATSASTTVTNCFALYKNTVSTNNAPIAMNRGRENIAAYGNYFMDEGYSFNDAYNKAMKLMYEDEVKTQTSTYGASMSQKSNYLYGTRLYAGINKSTGKYFAAGMVNNYNLNTVDAKTCYIKKATNEGGLATIYRPNQTPPEIATILLWYGDADNSKDPSMQDITDDLIQNYYTQVLDKRGPGTVSDLQVAHKKDSSAVYGRYEVTWTAAAADGIFPQNQIQNVSHYLVTLYKVDENGKEAILPGYQDIKVYGTRYLFDADDALAKAIGTGQFCVGVKAVNGTKIGDEVKSATQYFVRPLPTPKLEIRLKKQNSGEQPYGQYLVLTNASDYKNAGNWQVTAYLMNQSGTEITLNQRETEALITKGLGSATRLRATATPGTDATGAWMESARYDEEIGIPKTYYSTGDKGSNSGLVHGTATIGQPVITGSTADNLSITVTLKFTADTIFNTVPNYRVMLVGKYNGDEKISNAAEGTAAKTQPLTGQYVTLAAVEKPVYSSGTEFVLSNLPAVVFDGSYTDLKVISVPIDAGYPQVVTRWEITADEVLKAIGEGNNNPVSWNSGIEIVRGADGKFSYYHLTPLQFFAENDPWYSISGFVTKQIRTDNLNLTLLKAPTVSNTATGVVSTDNKLNYTFTWTQYNADGSADTNKHDYDVTLYGLLTEKDSETTTIAGKEKIELKDGVSLAEKIKFDNGTGTYTLTLCVDDDLASGSWRYDTVRLHVTRKPGDGDTNAIGLAGEADCAVQQRLSAVGQVNSIMRTNDNSANALNYDITWPASADAKGENTVTYTLYAEKLDGKKWTALSSWPDITKNSCTVDLEKYQGATLRFYVVANAVDKSKYCSPNGEYSNPLLVETRLAAPVVTAAKLSYQTPSQTQFLTEEKLTLTVQDASGGSYYYMGYLFKDAADYKQIADLANNYQKAQTPDDKAASLAALTNALNDMLADTNNPGRVLRLLPEGRMDGGAQAETTENGAAFALGDESFTMKPEYAGYWLLPALRSMSTDGTTASSNWYYYVADGLSVAPTQMQLPKIKLDAPQTNQNAFTTVDSKATLQLFGADGETAWTPASTEADISRFAVEWNAVNYSKETGEGLADKYQLEITSADDNTTDKITFTVAERNVMDKDGMITTKCGEILSVTKAVTIKDTAYTITIPQSEENGRTFYDLTTTVKTDEKGEAVLGEDKTPVLTTNHVTLEGHYELKDASGTPRYKLETFATLEYLDRDGEPGYRVTLPDLVDLLHKDDTRQRITGKVTVLAEGDADKTTASDKLELVVPNDGTAAALTMTAEEQPTQDAAAEQSPAAAPPVLRAARVLRATPETAAAEKEELPAVG